LIQQENSSLFSLFLSYLFQLKVMARGASSLGTFAAEKLIEKIQSKMRHGFPLVGLSPLAPLSLRDRNVTINLSFLQ
jgi:hypothetical protein